MPASDGEQVAPTPVTTDLRALAVYSLLTLVVIVALLLVMRALGASPTLVRSAGVSLGGDWVAFTDVNLRYTLSLPTGWQWLDLGPRDQDELLDRLASQQPYIRHALEPLGDTATDVEFLAVATGVDTSETGVPQAFVVVGESGQLRDLLPQEALDQLAVRQLTLSDPVIDTRLGGQPQARFTIRDHSHAYQCRHLFVTDEEVAAYLVAACTFQSRFNTLGPTLNEILDSFQLLER